eukprot:TRINITY_DN45131_c0_g1_i1.p1 TRINITY_DN45131_c0_g1~~TRINITY_DN45131_c0_g1_i1.p1  ORF type:complete len:246 (+),score=63.48 TRINITY_DN45131_c0_g1_i1:56-739(+)
MAATDIEELAAEKPPPPSGPLAVVDMVSEEERQLPAYALRGRLHKLCVAEGLQHYKDPVTGEAIYSTVYLNQRPCCGESCRHCPYNYVNVPKRRTSDSESDSSSETPRASSAASPARAPAPADVLAAMGLKREFEGGPPVDGEPLTAAEALGAELATTPEYAVRGKLHRACRAQLRDCYVMPGGDTAFFSQVYLQRMGECCGQRCMHCPYSYRACKKTSDSSSDDDD